MTFRQWLRYTLIQLACFFGFMIFAMLGMGFDEASGHHTLAGGFCALAGAGFIVTGVLAEKAKRLAQRRADAAWSVRS